MKPLYTDADVDLACTWLRRFRSTKERMMVERTTAAQASEWLLNLMVEFAKAGRTMSIEAPDPVVEAVRQDLLERSRVGMVKYGKTLEHLTSREAMVHLYTELLDGSNYLKRMSLAVSEERQSVLNEALEAFDNMTAPKGSGEFGHGWIVAREKGMAAIRALMDRAEPSGWSERG